MFFFFFFKQKTAYEMRISDWSSDVCSSDLAWRRAWFQVHKWIGLILAILIIPICLTGSALVWKGATDRIANPARYATSGATILPTERYTAAAQAVDRKSVV